MFDEHFFHLYESGYDLKSIWKFTSVLRSPVFKGLVGQFYKKDENRAREFWFWPFRWAVKWFSVLFLMKYLLFINLCHKTVWFHWWSSEVWQFKDQKLLIVNKSNCQLLIELLLRLTFPIIKTILYFAGVKRSIINNDSWSILLNTLFFYQRSPNRQFRRTDRSEVFPILSNFLGIPDRNRRF